MVSTLWTEKGTVQNVLAIARNNPVPKVIRGPATAVPRPAPERGVCGGRRNGNRGHPQKHPPRTPRLGGQSGGGHLLFPTCRNRRITQNGRSRWIRPAKGYLAVSFFGWKQLRRRPPRNTLFLALPGRACHSRPAVLMPTLSARVFFPPVARNGSCVGNDAPNVRLLRPCFPKGSDDRPTVECTVPRSSAATGRIGTAASRAPLSGGSSLVVRGFVGDEHEQRAIPLLPAAGVGRRTVHPHPARDGVPHGPGTGRGVAPGERPRRGAGVPGPRGAGPLGGGRRGGHR